MISKGKKTVLSLLLALALLLPTALPVWAESEEALSQPQAASEEATEEQTPETEAPGKEAEERSSESSNKASSSKEKAVPPKEEQPAEPKPAESKPGEPKPIAAVLHTNDVHCGIADYPKVVAQRELLKAQGLGTLLVDAGDAVQGEMIGSDTKGSAIIDLMNAMNYDIMVPGNHEFDYGMAQFFKLAGEMKESFHMVSANFYDLNKNQPVFDAYRVEEVGGVKIGFVGVCTPETYTKSTPVYFQDENGKYIYSFREQDLYDVVQKAVDAARSDGAQLVFILGHLGIEGTAPGWKSTDIVANTNGVDLVIDGHSHEELVNVKAKNKDGKEVPITSAGSKLSKLGQIIINDDLSLQPTLLNPKKDIDASANEAAQKAYDAIQTKVDEYTTYIEEKMKDVIAKSEVDLTTLDPETGKRAVRSAETNLGDLVADAYRTVLHADIALVNGGGIRDNIPKGDVTLGHISKVNPWNNEMCVIQLPGQAILDALEHSARVAPEENGGFLQTSGLRYTINLSVKESPVVVGDKKEFIRVEENKPRRVQDVFVGGKPIDPAKMYTVAGTKYTLQQAGDGYTIFAKYDMVNDPGKPDSQVLGEYIQKQLEGVISAEQYGNPRGEGRIRILAEGSPESKRLEIVERKEPTQTEEGYIKYRDLITGEETTETLPKLPIATFRNAIVTNEGKEIGYVYASELDATSGRSLIATPLDKTYDGYDAFAFDLVWPANEEGKFVDVTGQVEVSLLIPESMRSKDFKFYHDNGTTLEEIPFGREGDRIRFTTRHFSTFVFAVAKTPSTNVSVKPVADNQRSVTTVQKPGTNQNAGKNVKTGDTMPLYLIGGVAVVALVALVVLQLNKKSNKKS